MLRSDEWLDFVDQDGIVQAQRQLPTGVKAVGFTVLL
jgi:hypothetical protein